MGRGKKLRAYNRKFFRSPFFLLFLFVLFVVGVYIYYNMSDSTSTSSSSERTVKVANITSNAAEDIVRKLFEFLGPVTSLQLRDR